MKLVLDNLTKDSLGYIWRNMRDYDSTELSVQGFGRSEAEKLVDQPYSYTLYSSTSMRPVAVGGAAPWPIAPVMGAPRILLWGFGTDEADKYMIEIHKFTKAFIDFLADEEWQRMLSVMIWEKHDKSRRWLKRLGFVDSEYSFPSLNMERIILMERPDKCADQQPSV